MAKKIEQKKRKFLFICAHPDDDMLVGGTMAKLASRDWDVHEIVCTSAKNVVSESGEKDEKEIKDNRIAEVKEYCELLGAKEPIVLDPNKRLFDADEEVVLEVTRLMREIRPDVIVLMNKDDYHIEHTAAHLIGLRAFELACRQTQPELGPRLKDGILLQTDGLNVLPNPLAIFNTTDSHEKKMEASKKAYANRVNEYLLNFTNGMAMMRGSRLGYDFAEAYEMINPTWYKFKPECAEILQEFVSIGNGDYKSVSY